MHKSHAIDIYGQHPYDGHVHPFLCCASMKIYRKTYWVTVDGPILQSHIEDAAQSLSRLLPGAVIWNIVCHVHKVAEVLDHLHQH